MASSAFFPENSPRSFRATELACEFTRQGHFVKVITLNRGEATRKFCSANSIELQYLSQRKLKPVPSPPGFLNLFFRALNRLLLLLFEYPDIELVFKYKSALRRESGYDLLISFSVPYPVHWGSAWARKSNHRIADIWVADCGDPYVGDQCDSFRKLFYFDNVEKATFRKADYISIPIETARSAYFEEFHKKIVIIPQGMNFTELTVSRPEYVPNKVVTFGYAGSFIPGKRDPRRFLEYLLSLKLDYRFYIFTMMGSLISELAERSGGRIVIFAYVPREELIRRMAVMDFLVNFENSTPTQAPSKLIDYYVTGRPVLSVSSFDINTDAVNRFLERNYQSQLLMTDYDIYKIENVAASFLTLQCR
jgi:hypothetical protein